MSLNFQLKTSWPPNAWIAICRKGSSSVVVKHGRRVETEPNWFGEVVWNGPYSENAFDQTDVVFGSGARIVGSDASSKETTPARVNFVGSSSTLDRLHWAKFDDVWYVSNSLACLLCESGAKTEADYNYAALFQQILGGIDQAVPGIPTNLGEVKLAYFRNLCWNGSSIQEFDKPFISQKRNSFGAYREYLESELMACAENARSSLRKFPYSLLGTISTGFDSPTVSALGKAAGLTNVVSVASSRSGLDDNGQQLATRLGLETFVISRDEWKQHRFEQIQFPEVPFISADAKGEDVYFAPLANRLEGKVLLTGYCGSVWGGRSNRYYELRRTDPSGLSLSEFRLWAGFINFPVPLLGVYHADDLLSLMQSDEVSKWASGKDYDKPFSRFVLSSSGVPDDWYGVEKKAASVLFEDRREFLSNDSKVDFDAALSDFQTTQRKFVLDPASNLSRQIASGIQAAAGRTGELTDWSLAKRIGASSRLSEYSRGDVRFRYLFQWAIALAVQMYQLEH